jgi:hypothetical protein
VAAGPDRAGNQGLDRRRCAQLAGNAVGRFVPGAPTPFTVEMLRRAGVDTGEAAAAFASDRPLELAGRGIQWLLNTTVRRRHPVVGLPRELLADRDFIRTTLGGRWKAGVAAAGSRGQSATVTGRARLHRRRAAGAAAVHAWRPGLRRGGAGGTITVAGVPGSDALAATLLYRLAAYWLPIPAGASRTRCSATATTDAMRDVEFPAQTACRPPGNERLG